MMKQLFKEKVQGSPPITSVSESKKLHLAIPVSSGIVRKIIFIISFFLISFQPAFSQFRVIGYFPDWGGNISDIQFKKLTHINYAFMIPTSNGGYQAMDYTRLQSLVSTAHANGVKVIISVGGGGGGNAFSSIVANASYRTNFANNMLNFCNQYNIDGVDIDWEFPSEGTEANNFALMMQQLYNTMHNNGKLCTAAVVAYGGTSITNAVFNAVDFLNIMAYDETNYLHSTYDLGVKSVNYWVGRGLPASKAVLGVPFYGRDNCCSYKTWGYNEIIAMGGSPNSDTYNNQIGYNGIPTMKQKTSYAMQNCGGIMIWSIDTDDTGANSLLSAINEVVVANSNPVPDNLAKGKTVTASSVESNPNVSTIAANATDGFYGTRWSSLFADPQWIYVDLAGSFNVNRVKVTWENAYGKDYRVEISSDAQNWTALKSVTGNTSTTNDWTGLNGTGRYVRIYGTARATTYGYSIYEVEVYGNPIEAPYSGTPIAIPGTVQVENYDFGGEELGYHDLSAGNSGSAYRTDNVDVQATTDNGGGYNVGWTQDGEWLNYTVNVAATGKYDLEFRSAGTAAGAIRMEIDGQDVTGSVTLPSTSGWQTWATTMKSGVSLTAGKHILRLFIVTGGFNLNYVNVKAQTISVSTPYNGTPASVPGIVQAENYDLGGEGIAYLDSSAGNTGTSYRNDDVDVQASTDIGGGYNVGWTQNGEWLKYTVNVTSSGTYDVEFRTAGTGSGAIRMEVDGADVTGTVSLPNTTDWQTWASTIKSGISLTAGQHVIRLVVVTGGFNLNYVNIKTPDVSGPGYLHASGKNIVNNQGNFVIKAINLGDFMIQEGYMMNLGGGYQHIIKQKIADVVGSANADQFYKDYHSNFITKADIDSIASWGFNAIRLPMHYNLFTPLGQPDVYLTEGFDLVDNILGWCKQNNIYLILDLHAAPGGQSSGDICDYDSSQPSLWESQANRDQTVKLWAKLASRYANEQYIGGYDLINETNWTLSNNTLLMQLMQDITHAIRQVDNNHILFIEGNNYANNYTGMTPKWDNNMAYSFHKYWNDNSDGSLNFIFSIRDGQNVPVWMGEFGENSNNWIADAVTLVNNYNIGWAIWPYKKMSSVSGVGSFKQPSDWSALASYINGGSKPSASTGQAALNELLENIKVENCTFNKGYLYALFKQPGNTNTAPFANVSLPGKVLAANYDEGKNGYAYNDAGFQNTQYGSSTGSTTSWNNGWYYRNDGVDLQYSTAENGPEVGWTENGDWMQYTVNVAVSGSYTVKVRVAGNGGNISLSSDGTALISNKAVAATGGWDTWQTITLGDINLTAGKHTLRATINTGGFNISYFDFSTQIVVRGPYNGTPAAIPGKVEAENYDTGGQGVTYNDSDAANQGGAYRADGVDIQATTDTGGGYNVGYVAAGEWMEFTVNVAATGNYDAQFRVATTATGKSLHLEKAGQNISGSVALPNTGAWQTWQTVTVKNIAMTQGTQIIRFAFDTDGINLNYVSFVNSVVNTNQSPTVSLTSPANNATFTSPASITINASASDADGTISKVEFYNGSVLLGTSITAPYAFTWSNVAAGSYSLTAKATDNSGATTTSSAISVTVNSVSNQTPTVDLTSPSNNASFNAPASITLSATASDADGSVSKVVFYNGSTVLATVTIAPYNYTWSNVAAGTYTITAKVIDNGGATAISSAVTVKVNTVVTNTCSGVPQYVENGGYTDGSKVQNAGSQYQCKPYPYSGWCNGAAWAYAPGTGSYWTDAWTLVGPCSSSAPVAMAASIDPVQIYPNPTDGVITINIADGSSFDVQIMDMYGTAVVQASLLQSGSTISLTDLVSGLYVVKVTTSSQSYSYTIQKN